jgi:hypothetical protein
VRRFTVPLVEWIGQGEFVIRIHILQRFPHWLQAHCSEIGGRHALLRQFIRARWLKCF